jgi:hypothetical protein
MSVLLMRGRVLRCPGIPHILFQVFLAMLKGGLAELRGELRRGIIHEVAVLSKHISARRASLLLGRLLLLVWAAFVALRVRL